MVDFRDENSRRAFFNLYNQIKIKSIVLDIKSGDFVYIDDRFCLNPRDQFSLDFDTEFTPLD